MFCLKKLTAAILLACILCSCGVSAFAAAAFIDIPPDQWYTEAVEYVVEQGYFNGVSENQFDPTGSMTRGMFVTVLGRMANVSPEQNMRGMITRDSVNLRSEPNTESKILAVLARYTALDVLGETNGWYNVRVGGATGYVRGDLMQVIHSAFTDVAANQYYTPYVDWASLNGIVSGTTLTTFSPDLPISREQLCTILYNFSKVYEVELGELTALQAFADDAEISSWAREAVYTLQGIGVINGRDGNRFAPKAGATRAEVAAILKRYADAVGQSELPNAGVQFGVPVPESEAVTDAYFDDACFIGHSLVVGMSEYFHLENPDFYAVIGISASGILKYESFPLEEKLTDSSGKEVQAYGTLADVLEEKEAAYRKVYIMLGTNELGPKAEHLETYVKNMNTLIDLVRVSQPDAKIYLISTVPVSEERSLKDQNFNHENILKFNEALLEISSEKEVYYIDAFSLFADENGYLPAESCANDGIHLLGSQYALLKAYLKTHTA